ncbi:MAG: hypothetical protein KC505_01395 [Myxococcales bacterium]|nr:hypothetical protein [Myxococcales bacterium]USN50422.1 MAG: hypothetical protein H6731_09195 [Myxococcales bacterium]
MFYFFRWLCLTILTLLPCACQEVNEESNKNSDYKTKKIILDRDALARSAATNFWHLFLGAASKTNIDSTVDDIQKTPKCGTEQLDFLSKFWRCAIDQEPENVGKRSVVPIKKEIFHKCEQQAGKGNFQKNMVGCEFIFT